MDQNIKEKLLVKVEDEDADATDQHPSCSHGPTVLFYRQSQTPSDGFFACSAYRNRRLCSFRIDRGKWIGNLSKRLPYIEDYPRARAHSDIDPTTHLRPLSDDDANAQYFFDEKALDFFNDQCVLLKFDKVVCIGTPRLHFHLRRTQKIQSFLLDLDDRFAPYLSPQEFCLHNMCNNYFFYNPEPFEQFLRCDNKERVLIVTDPPFGCRTEFIAQTLRSLTRLYNRINCVPAGPLAVFWIYPYYMANYVQQVMPELQMCDYKLNYINHKHYRDVGAGRRAYGSPVRVFTNVPLELLKLRPTEGYKYCDKCRRFTGVENTHCNRCDNCCALNGQTYRHCQECDLCVKPNYVHCPTCRRCTQLVGHNCRLYQSKQRCWLCGQIGHIETNCATWLQLQGNKRKRRQDQRGGCLICGHQNHHERKCPKRGKYFKETEFMGQTSIVPLKT